MINQLTRRDFLKLFGSLPLSLTPPHLINSIYDQREQKNIVVIVFDALSACHIPFYGYQRNTMPNLSRLINQAIVYHNHYSSGNYTTPGTTSLLTGTHPWTHRAIKYNGVPDKSFVKKNIFSAFQEYYKITYTHNLWAHTVLKYLRDSVDDFIPIEEYLLTRNKFISTLFDGDRDISEVSWIRAMKKKEEGYAYSLFLSHLYNLYREHQVANKQAVFPLGLPSIQMDNYYLLEDSIRLLSYQLNNLPQPFLGYFHFWPPHDPYRTHKDFYQRFKNDSYIPIKKPIYSPSEYSHLHLRNMRVNYDEFILYVDREFTRFYEYMKKFGLLDNTWIILTSDHGEMFERGILGHRTPVLYEPIIRVPLVIFEPGRTSRKDIFTQTSSIDVLPTLLHVSGHRQDEWIEGTVLPPFNSTPPDSSRSIYAIEASDNEKFAPLEQATVSLIKDGIKLVYYTGYPKYGGLGSEHIELYNLKNDPEELSDLSSLKRETATELLNELKKKLTEVNQPYS